MTPAPTLRVTEKQEERSGATVLVLTVPMPPNLTNWRSGRSHWRVVYCEKKAYWLSLDAHLAVGLLPRPPVSPIRKGRLASVMVLGGAMDDDNAVARHKWLLDWLRTRGYVANDTKRNIEWAGFPEQRVSRKEPATITITLEAL